MRGVFRDIEQIFEMFFPKDRNFKFFGFLPALISPYILIPQPLLKNFE